MNNNKLAITGRRLRLAGFSLGLIVCLAVAAQGQTATDTSIDNFQADVMNPATLINSTMTGWGQGEDQREADLLTEDFTHDSSLVLLKEVPQTEKASGLPVVRAGYGQFFSANNLVPTTSAGIEAPSWLFLMVSFSF